MMYNNQNRQNVNVNTKFFTSYSDTSLVTVNAWNANLSIKFHPLKSVSENGQKIYAQDLNEVINVPVSADSAFMIKEGIENVIIPAINENKEEKIIFMVGNENARKCLSVFTEMNETGTVDTYLGISFNNTEEFVDNPATFLKHKLSTRKFKKGDEYKEVQTDLLKILDKLEKIDNLSQTIEHGIIYTNKVKEFARQQRPEYNRAIQQNYQAVENIVPTDGSISDFVPFS